MWEQLDYHIRGIFRVISKTYLFGVVRVDLLLHLIGGIILTLLIRRWKKSPLFALAMVLFLQILKEFYDSFTLNASLKESLLDTLVTISYPLVLVVLSFVMRRLK